VAGPVDATESQSHTHTGTGHRLVLAKFFGCVSKNPTHLLRFFAIFVVVAGVSDEKKNPLLNSSRFLVVIVAAFNNSRRSGDWLVVSLRVIDS
jgi:hypothetical protein